MLPIEITIIEMAHRHLCHLRHLAELKRDAHQAWETLHQLSGLTVLAHIGDGGLSTQACQALEDIERSAIQYERWIESSLRR